MLCSKCSEVVKPVVVVDIDGTLGDYHGHFLRFAWQYLGLVRDGKSFSYHAYTGDGSFCEWFMEQTGCDVRTWHDIKLAYRQGAMKRSMPPYDGAKELCALVQNYGGELWLCTTRPFLRLDRVDPDTRFWLEQQEIHYDGLIHDDDKYQVLKDRIDADRIVMILDDEIEQVLQADALFGGDKTILRRNAYNGDTSFKHLSDDLDAIAVSATIKINSWVRQHAPAHV